MKADEPGPDKLYEKFHVYKTSDVKKVEWPPENPEEILLYNPKTRIGADGEFIFVLRPETNDLAAVIALKAYAAMCSFTYPNLSRQILQKLRDIKELQRKVMDEEGVSLDEACKIIARRRKGG